MTDTPTANTLLDEDTAKFIYRHVSIMLAAANRENRPMVTRVYGCKVAPDRRSVTLFIPSTYNATLLENIRTTRSIAAVFTQPESHKTIQLKGNDAEILTVEAADHPVIQEYLKSLAEEIARIGYSNHFSHILAIPPEAMDTAIRFTPQTAFSQTPGPQAGKKLSA